MNHGKVDDTDVPALFEFCCVLISPNPTLFHSFSVIMLCRLDCLVTRVQYSYDCCQFMFLLVYVNVVYITPLLRG